MIRWILQTETSKACLLNTLKCGESWLGCGGKGKERYFVCVSLSIYFLDFYAVEISHFSCTDVQTKTRMHCFWASGLLVQQQAYLYDMCNLNLQTNYQKENLDVCFFFFYTEYLLCAMFTESLKLCIWPFFITLVTVIWFWGEKNKKLCFFPSLSHFGPNLRIFIPPPLATVAAGVAGTAPSTL